MKDSFRMEEEYWREIISNEILEAIESGSEINAYGAYLIAKNTRLQDNGDYDYF